MKRFATHRVYSLLTAEIKSSQVLELEEDGRVSKLYPFTEEISATEWLPGLVVLSPCPIWKNPEENFSEFKMRISKIPVCDLRAEHAQFYADGILHTAGHRACTRRGAPGCRRPFPSARFISGFSSMGSSSGSGCQ